MNYDTAHFESALPRYKEAAEESACPPASITKPEPRWLGYPELAERMGVCARTVRREVDAGTLPKPIKIRGCVRFDWLEVEAALKARKQN